MLGRVLGRVMVGLVVVASGRLSVGGGGFGGGAVPGVWGVGVLTRPEL